MTRQSRLAVRGAVDDPNLVVSCTVGFVGDPRAVRRDAGAFVRSCVRGQPFVRQILERNDVQMLLVTGLCVGDSPVAGQGRCNVFTGRRRDLPE